MLTTTLTMTSGTPAQVGALAAELAFLIEYHRKAGNTATLNFLLRYEALAHRVEQLEAALGLISEGPPSSLENGEVAGWAAEIARAALKEGAQ